MKTSLIAVCAVLGAALLAACGGTTAAPPLGSGSAAKPAASSWNDVIAAAKKEGKVSVIGPQGTEMRDALTQGFQKAYPGIEVDLQSLPGDQTGPKVLVPMAAGQRVVDLAITGSSTAIETLQPAGVIVPMKDWLVGPNDSDPSQWLNNKFTYSDKAGLVNLAFSAYVKAPWVVNSDKVNPAEFKSSKDLLNPKWKDKIVFRSPRTAGAGISVVSYWWATPSLGKDFIKQLPSQNFTIEKDDRQILDDAAHGKYLIAIGPSDVLTNEFLSKGLPIKQVSSTQLAEGAYTTSGNGTLVIFKEPPHPNATKLYLDYLLSKEGQTAWVNAAGVPSYRRDVPHEKVADYLVPKEGVEYQDNSSEELVKQKNDIVAYLDTVWPK